MLRDFCDRFRKARRRQSLPNAGGGRVTYPVSLECSGKVLVDPPLIETCVRIEADCQKRAARPKDAMRIEHERLRVIKMVHRIDAEEPIEGSRHPRELLGAPANDKR